VLGTLLGAKDTKRNKARKYPQRNSERQIRETEVVGKRYRKSQKDGIFSSVFMS
jgi:hypothetical protein